MRFLYFFVPNLSLDPHSEFEFEFSDSEKLLLLQSVLLKSFPVSIAQRGHDLSAFGVGHQLPQSVSNRALLASTIKSFIFMTFEVFVPLREHSVIVVVFVLGLNSLVASRLHLDLFDALPRFSSLLPE